MRAIPTAIVAALFASGCGGGGDEYGGTQATAAAAKCTSAPVIYADRAAFLASVKKPLTDTYGVGYQSSNAGGAPYSDAQMTAVRGETRYEALTFPNLNLVVSENFWTGQAADDPSTFAYCAGCNGNFKLHFDATSRSMRNRGVPSVGVDVVLHTSRHTDRGNPDPSEISLPGAVLVEFGNGQTMQFTVPPDIGYFGPQTYFIGLSDKRLIRSITIGTGPAAERHFWVIDNLTISGAPQGPCIEAL
jgi:hypothetical protein